MTKGRAVNFIRGRQFGWTDGRQQVPLLRFGRDDNFVGELTERKPLCGSRGALQVPPLRCASVGITKGWEVKRNGTLVREPGHTAGPSTALRFGRDDKG